MTGQKKFVKSQGYGIKGVCKMIYFYENGDYVYECHHSDVVDEISAWI